MSKVLFLAHRLPYPPHKGDKVRSYQLLCCGRAGLKDRVLPMKLVKRSNWDAHLTVIGRYLEIVQPCEVIQP